MKVKMIPHNYKDIEYIHKATYNILVWQHTYYVYGRLTYKFLVWLHTNFSYGYIQIFSMATY